MNTKKVRSVLMKNRVFLHCLFIDPVRKSKQRIGLATNVQCKAILYALHFISIGVIPLPKDNISSAKKTRKLFVVNEVQEPAELRAMIAAEKSEKIKYLKKVAPLFPYILHSLFHK